MRRDVRFYVLVFCMAVLAFSLPFTTLAQRESLQAEISEPTAEQDSSSMMLEAKTAAERDARNDINKLSWFGAGVGTFCIGGTIGCLVGSVIGNFIAPRDSSEPSGLMPFDDISGGAAIGGCVGFIPGVLVPLNGIYRYQSDPPPERLVGKSPEYIEFYTDTYKAKTRSIRIKWTAVGAASPILLLGLVLTMTTSTVH